MHSFTREEKKDRESSSGGGKERKRKNRRLGVEEKRGGASGGGSLASPNLDSRSFASLFSSQSLFFSSSLRPLRATRAFHELATEKCAQSARRAERKKEEADDDDDETNDIPAWPPEFSHQSLAAFSKTLSTPPPTLLLHPIDSPRLLALLRMSPSLSLPSAVEVDGEAAFSVAERSRKEGDDDDDGDDDGRERIGMRLSCCFCRSATDPPAAPRAPVCAVARCMMPGFVEKGGAVVKWRQR